MQHPALSYGHTLLCSIVVLVTIILSGSARAIDRPIALVGGMLLDGYEAGALHDSVAIIEGDRIVAAG